ncbi:hypothetical protein PPSIR1_11235 [Plesiocystis pacifica SIR-1]|uniref:Uncharacterized protein n=1 Tax=Plesiocystis pacifica SIR-1 TaxID=391625 RepID=A6G150_9BACT|nr:hypothetical protein PPSIR1_11235 [Plesiocystis pacifica SIR-1]
MPGGVVADPPVGDPRAPTVTLVTEKGDDAFVLNRIESDTTHFVPNGYVRMIHYRKLCATPCNVPVPATGRYFLTSSTARPSRAFELPGYRSHYELSVKPIPRWVGWLGFALAVVGPTAGVLLATMPIWVDMPKANARAAQIGGITLGLALGGTGVGLAYTRSRVTVR